MNSARCLAVFGLVVLLAACTSATSPSPSTAEPSASEPVHLGLPPGCQPIDLRAPNGERVDLTGEWAGTGRINLGYVERIWLNHKGDCVYGSVLGDFVLTEPVPFEIITNLSGQIGSDFDIAFDVVVVSHDEDEMVEYSTMVILIEWDDDGRIRLREDRAPGEPPDRCPRDAFACPDPVIWYRVDDAPPS